MERRSVRVPLTNLLDWRSHRGLTQEQLAAKSGLTRLTIYNLETGRARANPVTLGKLARGLGVSIPQLLAGPAAYEAEQQQDSKEGRAAA